MTATIMIATDGSAESWPAVRYATRLAVTNQAQLVFLLLGTGEADQQLSFAARALGERLTAETVCGYAAPESISRAAQERRVDLLVMGRSAFQESGGGAMEPPLAVARHCPVPMLLTANDPRCWDSDWRLKPRAVVPLDGSLECEAVLLHLARLSRVLPCSLLMVGLVPDGESDSTEKKARLGDLADALDGLGTPAQLRLIGTHDAPAAARYVAERTYDFVVLPVRANWPNQEGSFGPMTQAVVDAMAGNALLVRVDDFAPPDWRGVCPRG